MNVKWLITMWECDTWNNDVLLFTFICPSGRKTNVQWVNSCKLNLKTIWFFTLLLLGTHTHTWKPNPLPAYTHHKPSYHTDFMVRRQFWTTQTELCFLCFVSFTLHNSSAAFILFIVVVLCSGQLLKSLWLTISSTYSQDSVVLCRERTQSLREISNILKREIRLLMFTR